MAPVYVVSTEGPGTASPRDGRDGRGSWAGTPLRESDLSVGFHSLPSLCYQRRLRTPRSGKAASSPKVTCGCSVNPSSDEIPAPSPLMSLLRTTSEPK